MAAYAHVTRSRRGRRFALARLALLSALAMISAPAPTANAALAYKKLSAAGVKADRAVIQGRVVRVRIRAKRTVVIRLAVLRNGKVQQAWGKTAVRKGTRTLVRKLRRTPASSKNIKLRVVATRGRVRARGVLRLKALPLTPTSANNPPTAMTLSNATVAGNQPPGTLVGALSATDPDRGDRLTFALVAGAGSDDNPAFAIAGTALRTATALNLTKPSLSIRVRVTDGKGGAFERQFTITVTAANAGPTDIALTSSSIPENLPAATTVGVLSAADPDPLDAPTFALVAGSGDADNAQFAIAGPMLQSAASFDFEATASYSIRVRATDPRGATFEKQITITVTNANEAPTDILPSSTSFVEGTGVRPIATLSTADPDAGDTFTYALVPGDGSTDNGTFQISGSTLQTNATFTFPAPAKSIRVRSTDAGGLAVDELFTITVTMVDINDAPVADDETFNATLGAIGNTALVGNDPTDAAPDPVGPQKTITGDILDGDADADGIGSLAVVASTFATNDGGSVTLESDGDFTFTPAAATSCTDTSDFFDYTVTDQNTTLPPGTPATDVGRVTVGVSGCVWYVSNTTIGNAGTSTAPFATLAQAQSASSAGHTIYVSDGDNTTTGYTAGFDLKANQRLLGEAAALQVGSDLLQVANPAARPTITDNNADVISLAAGNSVRGVELNPQGAGGGIAGGIGDNGGTIDDVRIVDSGPAGTQPGLELDGTTGSFDISNLTVDSAAAAGVTSGSIGVRLNNAGTVNFVPAGTVAITTAGAKGLDATGTSLGTSAFDEITVTNSSTGAVSMVNTAGTTTLGDGAGTDLLLTTTSGATPALNLANAGTVRAAGAGTNNIAATGGPAVDATATSATLDLDAVSSTGSANDGINLAGLGSGTFSAASGSIAGAAGIAFDLDGGSGNVTYPGALNNGSGQAVEITGRSGGDVSLSGAIADSSDAGGGIVVSANSGGSTTFGNPAKTLNTGAGNAVVFSNSDGHTLTFSGGGLDVDTTSGKGVEALTAGTLNVTGTGNTIDTGSGKALNVSDTDVGASPLTFQRIASSGANGGIRLNNTGANSALSVTSTRAGACTAASPAGCTGGVIQNTTGADDGGPLPAGAGVVLNNTRGISLARMHVHDHSNYGIRGTNVVGLTIADSVINGSNGTSALTAHKDGSARFEELTGTVNVTNTAISGGFFTNLMVDNTAGELNATLDNVDSGTLDATGGDDAVQFEGIGTSDMNVDYRNSAFTTASGDLFQYIGDGSGGGDLDFTGNTLTNNEPSINTGGGGVALVAGAKGAATMDVLNNTMRDSKTNALTIIKSRDNATGAHNLVANIANNAIGLAGTANSGSLEGDGMEITTFGDGNATFDVTNNAVRQYNSSAIQFVAGSGVVDGGQFNLDIAGNSAANPGTNPSITLLQGVRVDSGVATGDTFATCVSFGPNSITGSSDAANKDFRLVAGQSTTMRQPGYAGGAIDGAAFAAFAAGKIGGGAQGTAVANPPATFSGTGTTCP
jgi:hypothetical protein